MNLAQLKARRAFLVIVRTRRYNRWLTARRRGDVRAAEAEHKLWRQAALDAAHINALIKVYRVDRVSAELAVGVSDWEGLGPNVKHGLCYPYWDSIGSVWTIGFGHIEGVSRNSRPLTITEAETLLEHDLDAKYAPQVYKYTRRYGLKLDQKEFDALVSIAYNVGPGIMERGHSLGDAMAARNKQAIADAILLYNHGGGGVVEGLTKRRHWESALFLGGSYKVNN